MSQRNIICGKSRSDETIPHNHTPHDGNDISFALQTVPATDKCDARFHIDNCRGESSRAKRCQQPGTPAMSDILRTDELFFGRTGMDAKRVEGLVDDAIGGTDDGELFLEYRQSESITFDDGRVRNASFDTSQGFGLRAVAGEATGYAHSSELSEAAIARASETVKAVRGGGSGAIATPPVGTNRDLYADINPLGRTKLRGKGQVARRDRRLCTRRRSARAAGHCLIVGQLAGYPDRAGRRPAGRRYPSPGAPQCIDRGGRRRSSGNRFAWGRWPRRLRSMAARGNWRGQATRHCARLGEFGIGTGPGG